MSNKIYKVNGDHLNALGEAAGIIVAFLESIKADDALLNFSAAQALLKLKGTEKPAKPASTTLEQAVDEEAERKLAKLDHAHAVCKCKKGGAVATTCKCGKHEHKVSQKPAKPLPKTMKEIAQTTGVEYKRIHKYAYCHGIGTATRTADGHQARVFTDDEVREIIRHFEGGK